MLKAIFLFALNTIPDCLPEFFVRRYSLTAFFPAVIFFSRIVRETACPFSATRITSFEARAPAAERNRRRENVCILVLRSMFIESNVTFLPHKGCTPIPRVFRWTWHNTWQTRAPFSSLSFCTFTSKADDRDIEKGRRPNQRNKLRGPIE